MAAKQHAAERLLELLKNQPKLTASNAELAHRLNVSPRSVKAAVAALRRSGVVDVDYRASNAAAGDSTGRTIRLAGGR